MHFYWMGRIAVTVRGNSISVPTGSAGLAAIDTGTTLIGAPSSAVQAIYAQIPNSQPLGGQMQGFYQFRQYLKGFCREARYWWRFFLACNEAFNLTLSFGGQAWPVSDADTALPNNAQGTLCLGGVFDLTAGSNVPSNPAPSSTGTPAWVVGDTFLVCLNLRLLKTSTDLIF